MAFEITDLKESLESISPNTAGATPQDGRATWDYIYYNDLIADPESASQRLLDIMTEIFGTTSTKVSDTGKLNRTMPIAHPVWPYWYAVGLSRIQGIGSPIQEDANFISTSNNNVFGENQIPEYLLYQRYKLTIEFAPRPYIVAPDTDIQNYVNGTLVTDDGIPNFNINYQPISTPSSPTVPQGQGYFPPAVASSVGDPSFGFYYPNEWIRYTDWHGEASPDYITAKQGNQVFLTHANTGNYGDVYSGTIFPAMPKMFMQNQIIKFRWRQVPYRYISSPDSFIRKAIGRINQFDWYLWEHGTLLYINYAAVPYTPPSVQLDIVEGAENNLLQLAKLVDIEFTFLETQRLLAPGDDPYGQYNSLTALGGTPRVMKNNWIYDQGHNLMPHWSDRQFHYACTTPLGKTTTAQNSGIPSWLSFPFELFFVDPDTPVNNVSFR